MLDNQLKYAVGHLDITSKGKKKAQGTLLMPQLSRLCACHVQTPVQHDHTPNHFLLSQAISQEKPFLANQNRPMHSIRI